MYPEKRFQGAAKPPIGRKLNRPALISLPYSDLHRRGSDELALKRLTALAAEQGVSEIYAHIYIDGSEKLSLY